MRSLRTAQVLPRPTITSTITTPRVRKMSFIPQSCITPASFHASRSTFHPLFRLLDDFDSYARQGDALTSPRSRHGEHQPYAPKFDVKETKDAYELHGELPGIEQKNIAIEFSDANTMSIRGRTETSYTSDDAPKDQSTPAPALEENGPRDEKAASPSLNPTVEDEYDNASIATPTTTATNDQQVVQSKDKAATVAKATPTSQFWVSERSVGEFARTFTFPGRVDQDQVTATLRNGILSVTVPKAKKAEPKRIQIS